MNLTLSASQWRLLGAVEQGTPSRRFAQPLVDCQAADLADLVRLDAARLVRCFVGEAVVDLAEHLSGDGSPMVVAVLLGEAGARYLATPRHRISQRVGFGPMDTASLSYVCKAEGVDWLQIEPLVHRRHLRLSRSLTAEPVDSHDVPKLPPENVRLTLTPLGRMFLPLG